MPWFKRGYRGLYGNKMTRFGNKVSFAENKTRRTWKPNVQTKTLRSETLKEKFKCRVTTHVLRCIRKAGGFDQYLLKAKDTEIKYPRAVKFKYRIKQAIKEGKQAGGKPQSPKVIETEPSHSEVVLQGSMTTAHDKTTTVSPLRNTAPVNRSRGLLDLLDF